MKIQDLIARDGLSCGLCKQPVDLSFAFPNPLSASIGHVIPLSRGGGDDAKNLRLEHWGCNWKKMSYLDEELDASTLAPPNPVEDIVTFIAATERQRQGCSNGGKHTHELHPDLARKMGLRNGPANIRKMSREAKARGGRNRSPETMSLAGKRGGPKGIRKMSHEDHVRGGKNGSREDKSRAGTLGGRTAGPKVCHQRWHIARGIVNPDCRLCREGAGR